MRENQIIVKMPFGSELYGTDTPDSDMDIKGIYKPNFRDTILGKANKSVRDTTNPSPTEKNTKYDIETELYSIQYFIELASKGETVALDMLHCPPEMLLHTSSIWTDLVSHRHLFYTRNLNALVGYARKQAGKYGVKGSRLETVERVISFLSAVKEERLADVWDSLPSGEFIFKDTEIRTAEGKTRLEYEVCGRKVQDSVSIEYALMVFSRIQKNYGARAEAAKTNNGIDWKAISHAMRAAIQVRSIFKEGTIVFPLAEAPMLLSVKKGERDYITDVAPMLESLLAECDAMSLTSDLPEKVDPGFWDDWLFRILSTNEREGEGLNPF